MEKRLHLGSSEGVDGNHRWQHGQVKHGGISPHLNTPPLLYFANKSIMCRVFLAAEAEILVEHLVWITVKTICLKVLRYKSLRRRRTEN